MSELEILIAQHQPSYLETERNLDRLEELIGDAKSDLIVLPEFASSGYYFRSTEDARRVSERPGEGAATTWMEKLSARKGGVVVGGFVEQSDEGLYNSAGVWERGQLRTVYRKAHLFNEEQDHFLPGDTGLPVLDVSTRSGVSYALGVMICFDWVFPEAARTLALRGADVIAHPSNLVLPHCPDAMPLRALENGVFTATANRIGTDVKAEGDALTFIGRSRICGPDGDVLGEAPSEEEALLMATVDLERARSKRIGPRNDRLADRRPEQYELG